jgi:hypothetical protein
VKEIGEGEEVDERAGAVVGFESPSSSAGRRTSSVCSSLPPNLLDPRRSGRRVELARGGAAIGGARAGRGASTGCRAWAHGLLNLRRKRQMHEEERRHICASPSAGHVK